MNGTNTSVNIYFPFMNYRIYENSIWNVIISIYTVGYGDLYPRTLFGKIITVIIVYFGLVMVSIIDLTMFGIVDLNSQENNVYFIKN